MEMSPQESDLQNKIDAAQVAEKVSAEVAAESSAPIIKMQHVIITLADGRRGVFMGPELIKEVEMTLGMVPKLVSVDFDPPRAVAIPVSREEVANEVKAEDNQNVPAAPEAGVEQNS